MGCARRYGVVTLAFIGLLQSLGLRTCFSIVMVHVVRRNSTNQSVQLFPQCTTKGTSRDLVLHWTSEMVYMTHSAYFLAFCLSQLPGGILSSRFPCKRVCGLSVMVTSILFAVLALALETHYYIVLIIRTVQGIAEGCILPAMNGTISAWAPRTQRTRMLTVAYAGCYLSPAVAMVSAAATACYFSWSAVLFIYGGIGVIWSLLWIFAIYETPAHDPHLDKNEKLLFRQEGQNVRRGSKEIMRRIPWTSILCSLPVTALCAGSFCRNWVFALLITEQPQFFKDVFHMETADIGFLSALPHILMAIAVITCGFLVDALIKREIIGITCARKMSQVTGFGVEGACLLALGFTNSSNVALLLLCVGVAFSGFAISGYQVNPLDLAPQYASVLTGVSRLGVLGGAASTFMAGRLVRNHSLEDWQYVFIIAGCVHLGGVIYYAIFASGQRQPWADGCELELLIGPSGHDHKHDAFCSSSPAESPLRTQYGSIYKTVMINSV